MNVNLHWSDWIADNQCWNEKVQSASRSQTTGPKRTESKSSAPCNSRYATSDWAFNTSSFSKHFFLVIIYFLNALNCNFLFIGWEYFSIFIFLTNKCICLFLLYLPFTYFVWMVVAMVMPLAVRRRELRYLFTINKDKKLRNIQKYIFKYK